MNTADIIKRQLSKKMNININSARKAQGTHARRHIIARLYELPLHLNM